MNLDSLYWDYIAHIEQKQRIAEAKYAECYDQVLYIYNTIYPYREQIESAGIRIGFETEFKMGKLSNFYTERDLNVVSIPLFTIDEDLIKNYILAYCRAKQRLNNLDDYINKMKRYKLPIRIFKYIIKSHNIQIAKKLLTGYVYTVGHGVGQIYIKKIRRIFRIYGKEATKNIDWGETNKLKKKLIEEGVDIYTKDNPSGEQYLVHYTTDYMYWFWWDKGQKVITNSFLYTFTPTNFINTPERSQIHFVENAKNKEEIINTKDLGNRDKLYCLIRFDPNHGYNFITDEREYLLSKQSASDC